MSNPRPQDRARALRARVEALLDAIAAEESARHTRIDAVLPHHRASAENLAHYLGLRHQDVRALQRDLASVGLSSLGRCEGHVKDTLVRLRAWLAGDGDQALAEPPAGLLGSAQAESLLHRNTRALFGPCAEGRHVYILVTAPDAVEATPEWADRILAAGADLLRINGAHGTEAEWAKVASTFRERARACGRTVRIFLDLPGPKLRVAVPRLEKAVLHVPRDKDRLGRTLSPSCLRLVAEWRGAAELPVGQLLPQLRPGDTLHLRDAGGRKRVLVVQEVEADGASAVCDRSLYLTAGLRLTWRRSGETLGEAAIGSIPPVPGELRIGVGDTFLLRDGTPGPDAAMPALVLEGPELLSQVLSGERVLLDDGKVVAIAEERRTDGIVCRVRNATKSPARIRSGKGISFPDSHFAAGKLGVQDEAALAAAFRFADGVEVSFVNTEEDVALIGGRIAESGRQGFGMVLKLETRGAMKNLPAILFEAMKHHPVGLMIARGDLATELSFERLAEMQEELLWFGEACHLPVVWATQVLDSLAHLGIPTRAEVTDAAMAMRAECVMLNKGPFAAEAVRMLDDIIRKMEAHQFKKRSLLRKLAVG
ncbi:MAG TPA: pyruvate kinase [Polyangiaceae bacterium]|nr:pyruvate kinase [Polyangiaceae bacterium]